MNQPGLARIFHICTRDAATEAIQRGQHAPASLVAEGFIHLSQAHQIRGVMDAFYVGVPDLIVLVVDPARLTAPLRFEAAATPRGAPDGKRVPAAGLKRCRAGRVGRVEPVLQALPVDELLVFTRRCAATASYVRWRWRGWAQCRVASGAIIWRFVASDRQPAAFGGRPSLGL